MNTCCKPVVLALLLGVTTLATAAPKPGSAFPSWSRLSKDAAGAKVVLVDFWASWCAPCKASFPELDKLQAEYGPRGFALLAVSVDEEAGKMQDFLKAHPVSFKVLHDVDQSLVAGADIEAMPTSFLLDGTGRILAVHRGFEGEKTVSALRAEIERALGPKETKP
jgi:thiol-disulfide isomerase/thioredoxin